MVLTAKAEQTARKNGHPPVAEGVVCVDFDGTIAPWGDLFGYPEPLPGAKAFLKHLRDEGYTVIIFTSRLSTVWHEHEGRTNVGKAIFEQVEYLRKYCEKYDIIVDGVTAEKIPAEAYIDDKAIEYNGSWRVAKSKFTQRTAKRVSPKREEA